MHAGDPPHNPGNSAASPESVLQQYWGYPAFRPLQRDIIEQVLQGKDCLALLPTGGGKSVCYQVPALIRPGICLVISPLIALMRDQVQQLQDRGVNAEALYSGMHYTEIDRILDNCVYGQTKLLYLSPERLKTPIAVERIKRMQVSMIAVDEAHCVSQWGHDFRPAYLELIALRELHPDVPWLALTASATEVVRKDIMQSLQLRDPKLIQGSFRRSNLSYLVYPREDKWQRTTEILQKLPGSKLIYTRSRSKASQLAKLIAKQGMRCEAYHAGMSAKARNLVQERWIEGVTPTVVCTTAFGMGIDKPDVRAVLHFEMPGSLEEYYQEAGRAGRDGKRAFCVLLYDQSDIPTLHQRSNRAYPEVQDLVQVYRALCGYYMIAVGEGAGSTFDLDYKDFLSRYQLEAVKTYHCLEGLERDGWISMNESISHPSTLLVEADPETLEGYQVQFPEQDLLLKTLLRNYEGLFLEPVKIRETDIAKLMQKKEQEVIDGLHTLARDGIVAYVPSSESPRITFVRERVEDRNLSFDVQRIRFLREQAMTRVHHVEMYVTGERCREQYILEYFGETGSKPCGSCDICRRKLKGISYESVLLKIPEHGISLKELMQSYSATDQDEVKDLLSILEADELIIFDHDFVKLRV